MTRDEAYQFCLKYFNGDSLAAGVAVDKYLLVDENENYVEKDLQDVFDRNINEIMRIEQNYGDKSVTKEELQDLFYNNKAILQGSPLYGLGNPYAKTTLSNCYVVDSPRDSVSGILDSAKTLANLFKSRGGCGIDISTLRPEGSKVSNSARFSTGAWSFAGFFSDVTKTIGQCIEENQLVLTSKGMYKIKDVQKGVKVWTKQGWVEVVDVVCNGEKDVYEIEDKNGYSIKTTLEHQFVTLDENGDFLEKNIGNFSIGEKLIMIPGTMESEQSSECPLFREVGTLINVMTPSGFDIAIRENASMAFVMGAFLGYTHMKKAALSEDGYFEMYFKKGRHNLASAIARFLKQSFDIDVIIFNLNSRKMLRVSDEKFIEFLQSLHFVEKDGDSLYSNIPPAIFNSPKNVQMSFLSGFFDTQRMYYPSTVPSRVMVFPNKEFAEKIMQLLMSMGVMGINLRFQKRLSMWALTISCGSMEKRFLDLMKHTAQIGEFRYNKIMNKRKERKSLSFAPKDIVMTPVKHKNVNYKTVSVELFDSDAEYRKEYPHAVVVTKLKSIRYAGKKPTYDLVLEKEHLFYCQGFYVHNSGRRGALMEAMHIGHPDSEKFMTCKLDKKKVTAANISIKFSDEFMKAVEQGSTYLQKWPIDSENPQFTKTVVAKDLWKVFVESNIASAEPGALFWDRMVSYTPNSSYRRFKPVCVNPCAEVGMAANSNCRLMSLNLNTFVINAYTEAAIFDYDSFNKSVKSCIVVLDDLVDLDLEKMRDLAKTNEPDVKEMWEKFIDQTISGREIGLGTHGLADCLASLGLRYGDVECYDFIDLVYKNLCYSAYKASKDLAGTRGAFPEYNENLERGNSFFGDKLDLCGPRRNISMLTSAPTGSISILHQVSSGIEPIFKVSYVRRRKVDPDKATFVAADGQMFEEYTVYHHTVNKVKEVLGDGAQSYIDKYFIESHKVDYLNKIKMVSIIQQYIDHSISQTLNLPKGISFDFVSDIYLEAWKLGLKGLTIYVDGSREGVLVSEKDKTLSMPESRPESLSCDIHHTTIHGEKWVVFVGLLEGRPYEVFCGLQEYIELSQKVKNGLIIKKKTKKAERGIYDLVVFQGQPNEIVIHDIVNTFKNEEHMVLGRMISLSLRQGGKLAYVCEQLAKDDNSDFMSYNKVIARILKKYIQDGEKPENGKCSVCGGNLVYQEGCPVCLNCGFTKCS